jgi:peptidoglycan/xylan/chitin deacetylase (PgdA/CDA1 family)
MDFRQKIGTTIVGGVARAAQAWSPIGEHLLQGLTVFLFHDVCEAPSAFQTRYGLVTHPDVFATQLEWIARTFEIVHPSLLLRQDLTGVLPQRAAIITFDDSWAGTFEVAFPLLERMGIPAVAFLNMATVLGEPDIAAMTTWHALEVERATGIPVPRSPLPIPSDLAPTGPFQKYRELPEFLEFQGPTARPELLAAYDGHANLSFASHMFDHRHAKMMTIQEFCLSFELNEAHLARYRNSLPLLAFPFGTPGVHFEAVHAQLAKELGAVRVFSSHSCTNRIPPGPWLDRVELPAECNDAQSLMEATCKGWVRNVFRRPNRILKRSTAT